MKAMLKIKLVLYSTTLLDTKIFSHHDVGICRDHTKDTWGTEAKHNLCLLFCTMNNIQKAWNDLKYPIITESSTLVDNPSGKFESQDFSHFQQDAGKSVKYFLKFQKIRETK